MKCGIIVPRENDMVGERRGTYLAECIRERNHNGSHVIKTPEGVFYAWEDDLSCDCCTGDDDSPCYIFWKISEHEALSLSKKQI